MAVTIPYVFTPGTKIQSAQVNANFAILGTQALNATGDTLTGTLVTRAILPSADATYALGTGSFRYTSGSFSGAVTSSSVVTTTATATAVTATTLSGNGAAITALNGSSVSTGTVAQARGGTGLDTTGATNGQLLVGKTSDHTLNLATLTAGTGISVTNGAGTITLATVGQMALLKQGSGTDTNAAAATVDTIAISGLTVKDTLLVIATLGSTTQATATPRLRNTTDSVDIGASAGNVNAGAVRIFKWYLSDRQTATTAIAATLTSATDADTDFAVTFSTAWTGAWTLGLRHNGVTAGGTFDYQWSVYKLSGQ